MFQRASIYYLEGKKRVFVGQGDLALEDYQAAAALAEDATFLAAQGHIYVKKRFFLEAELMLQQALELNPQHADALYGLGLLSAEKEEYAQAIDFFKQALAVAPDNPHLHYSLAVSYQQAGDSERAMPHIRRAQELGLVIGPSAQPGR